MPADHFIKPTEIGKEERKRQAAAIAKRTKARETWKTLNKHIKKLNRLPDGSMLVDERLDGGFRRKKYTKKRKTKKTKKKKERKNRKTNRR